MTKTQLRPIKLSLAYESATNPRGKDFEGAAFDDLVASIKAKGVLVPIIVRPKAQGKKEFEVVAGNRRFRAAQKAGLAEIPASIENLSDTEAKEVQIIENLQRQDVHPLEEGEAYRDLVENSHLKLADLAIKVGKSESYIRGRLFLTNLVPSAGKAYREGNVPDTHAVAIAKLAPVDQEPALKKLLDSSYMLDSVKRFSDWIRETFFDVLGDQPWLKDKKVAVIVGPCTKCPPNRETLFGSVKEGQCTSTECWLHKMSRLIEHKRKENPKLVLVSTEYSGAPKGVLNSNNYEKLPQNEKKHCKHVEPAIVAHGDSLASMLSICRAKQCREHQYSFSYQPKPEELAKRKAERKRELAREKTRKARKEAMLKEALAKIKWPMTSKTLNALLIFVLKDKSIMLTRPIAVRHGIAPTETKRKSYYDAQKMVTEREYGKPLLETAVKKG